MIKLAPSHPHALGRTHPLRRFLSGFRRITTTGNYIPEIDGLRFIAIALVLMCHVGNHVAQFHDRGRDFSVRIFDLGNRGVELFFVISGFVLAMPFIAQRLGAGPRVSIKSYFLRRVTRLEPPYLAALVFAWIAVVLALDYQPDEQLRHAAVGAMYLHGATWGVSCPALVVAWSLEIEVQFYILMPLLAFVFAVKNPLARRAILIAGMLVPVTLQWIDLPPITQWSTFHAAIRQAKELGFWQHVGNYIQFFAAGMLAADVYLVSWKSKPRATLWGDIVWFVGWPILFFILALGAQHLARRYLFAPLACILYLALFRSVLARRMMSWPIVATIGGMCYSIYLIHLPVIQLIAPPIEYVRERFASYSAQLLAVSAIMLPAILLVSALFYRLIERPCMRRDWPMRLWNRVFTPAESITENLT